MKFSVGDLVVLSPAGVKEFHGYEYADSVMQLPVGVVGVIEEVYPPFDDEEDDEVREEEYPYRVLWRTEGETMLYNEYCASHLMFGIREITKEDMEDML